MISHLFTLATKARPKRRRASSKLPNRAERMYLGALRRYADGFREAVLAEVRAQYPELVDRKDGEWDESAHPRDEQGRFTDEAGNELPASHPGVRGVGGWAAVRGPGNTTVITRYGSPYHEAAEKRETEARLRQFEANREVLRQAGVITPDGIQAGGHPEAAGGTPRAFVIEYVGGGSDRVSDKPGEQDTHVFAADNDDVAGVCDRDFKGTGSISAAKERVFLVLEEKHPLAENETLVRTKSKDPAYAFNYSIERIEEGLRGEGVATRRVVARVRKDGQDRRDALTGGPFRGMRGIRLKLTKLREKLPFDIVGAEVADHAQREAERVIGLKNSDMFLRGQVSGWRRDNVDLITRFTEEQLDRVESVLENYDGLRVEDTASELESVFGVTRARAELIARDQVLKLNSDMAEQSQRAAGVTHYRWSTSQDSSVRDDHSDLEGEVFSWDEPPITNQHEVDRGKPERRNHPGQDFQCRCLAIPVLDEYDLPAQDMQDDQ